MIPTLSKNIIAEKSYTLQFLKTVDKDGNPFYAVVLYWLKHFEEVMKSPELKKNILNQGILISSGKGHDISEKKKQEILEYFRENYLKKMQ